MGSQVRQHWFALGMLSSVLFAFAATSLSLAAAVSTHVLLILSRFDSGWPLLMLIVPVAFRALGSFGALGLSIAFPGLFALALARRWSSLRFLTAAFGGFVLLCLAIVLLAAAALIPYSGVCATGARLAVA
jgi:hypothetical protein